MIKAALTYPGIETKQLIDMCNEDQKFLLRGNILYVFFMLIIYCVSCLVSKVNILSSLGSNNI